MPHNRYHNPLDPWYVDEDVAETRHGQRGKAFGENLQESTDRQAAEARKAAAARLRGGNAGAQSVEALERNIASRSSMSPADLALASGPAAGGQPSVIPQSEPQQSEVRKAMEQAEAMTMEGRERAEINRYPYTGSGQIPNPATYAKNKAYWEAILEEAKRADALR